MAALSPAFIIPAPPSVIPAQAHYCPGKIHQKSMG